MFGHLLSSAVDCTHKLGRVLLALSIVLTSPASDAKSEFSFDATPALTYHWPAFSYQFKSQRQSVDASTPDTMTISIVSVPVEHEGDFIKRMSTQVARKGADPTTVVYQGDESFAPELERQAATTEPGKLVAYKVKKGSGIKGQFSLDGVKRAGTWVAVAGTGIASTMLYISFAIEPATAASLVVAFLMVLTVKFQPLMLDYLNGGKRIGRDWAERLGVKNPTFLKGAGEVGKTNAAFMYHFATNSTLSLALNLGDLARTFGSAAALADLMTMTASNVLSGSTWDMAFARMMERSPTLETERIVRLMGYANRIFLMAVGPLLFVPEVNLIGMSILAVYGAFGVVANFRDQEFYNAAERVVEKLENSEIVSRALAGLLNASESVKVLIRPLRSHPLCAAILR